MKYTFEQRRDVYTELWASMEIRPERKAIIERQADKIISFKPRYDVIEAATGVPWYLIGLMHLRESNFDFNTHLHNGDPLTDRTYHVPAGRPLKGEPPFIFEESAEDALRQKGLDKIKDWSIERVAYTLELFNGFGYVQYQINSPYLWAGTNHYTRGKYVRDHVFSANTVDVQLGTMAVIRCIFDKVGQPAGKSHTEIAKSAPKAEPKRPTTKEMAQVSRKSWWTRLIQWLGLGGLSTTLLGKFADMASLDATKNVLDGIKAIWTEYGAEVAIITCVAIICFTVYMMKLQKDDVQEGRATPSGATE